MIVDFGVVGGLWNVRGGCVEGGCGCGRVIECGGCGGGCGKLIYFLINGFCVKENQFFFVLIEEFNEWDIFVLIVEFNEWIEFIFVEFVFVFVVVEFIFVVVFVKFFIDVLKIWVSMLRQLIIFKFVFKFKEVFVFFFVEFIFVIELFFFVFVEFEVVFEFEIVVLVEEKEEFVFEFVQEEQFVVVVFVIELVIFVVFVVFVVVIFEVVLLFFKDVFMDENFDKVFGIIEFLVIEIVRSEVVDFWDFRVVGSVIVIFLFVFQ